MFDNIRRMMTSYCEPIQLAISSGLIRQAERCNNKSVVQSQWFLLAGKQGKLRHNITAISGMRAKTRDRTGDLQIFSLTLSQLSYRGAACR